MDTYRVVVGVDGSEGGARALRWAARETAERGGVVRAVTAWSAGPSDSPASATTTPAVEQRRAQEILDDAVRTVTAEFPEVIVASEVIEGHPALALAKAARDAELLVVGSHGHGRLRHAVLGSVGDECVRAANCPVVIVPAPRPATAPGPGPR